MAAGIGEAVGGNGTYYDNDDDDDDVDVDDDGDDFDSDDHALMMIKMMRMIRISGESWVGPVLPKECPPDCNRDDDKDENDDDDDDGDDG